MGHFVRALQQLSVQVLLNPATYAFQPDSGCTEFAGEPNWSDQTCMEIAGEPI
jgi:hypothetical protein